MSLTFDGLDTLIEDMSDLANLPDDVIDEMLEAAIDVVLDAQYKKGIAYGVHRTGDTLKSLEKSKPREIPKGNGRCAFVYFDGKNPDGNRNAEVAFINEFGKEGQPARPFIRDAVEECADKSIEAAAQVYDNFLKTKRF